MALSKSVSESLTEAESHLRNALAFAARNEKAFVGKHIADLIFDITNIIKTEEFIDTMENLHEKFNHE
jgi:ribosomal protein S8